VLPVKLQEMFGATETPTILDGAIALHLHLLSPAGRPLQITRDIRAFWDNAYSSVKAEMKGRYPKHPWPDDPLAAAPTRHTKNRLNRK
jgi:ATP-dependent helicase HrpB